MVISNKYFGEENSAMPRARFELTMSLPSAKLSSHTRRHNPTFWVQLFHVPRNETAESHFRNNDKFRQIFLYFASITQYYISSDIRSSLFELTTQVCYTITAIKRALHRIVNANAFSNNTIYEFHHHICPSTFSPADTQGCPNYGKSVLYGQLSLILVYGQKVHL